MGLTIQELRDKLQTPRRSVDTLYGRLVMRRLSIYLTAAFSRTHIAPAGITALSVVAGWAGCWELYRGNWLSGILLVNLWYLLDHVDGELARLRGVVSATGLFFDTITNALVAPWVFLFLGISLQDPFGNEFVFWGIAAFYSTLMLLVVPYCEATVLLQWAAEKRGVLPAAKMSDSKKTGGTLFGWVHTSVTFPVALPAMTLWILIYSVTKNVSLIGVAGWMLKYYAVAANLVWLVLIAKKVLRRELDARLEIPKK